MAGLRKGKCYNTKHKRAYTRKSKYKGKGYIKAIPPNKIVKYDQGNLTKEFDGMVNLRVKQEIQIRHNAIESARQAIHRNLIELLGNNYHLKVRVYPHHILRENKMITGAGADRMQTGMQRAFGKAIGSAAQVKKDQAVISVLCEKKDIISARAALRSAIPKLPGKYYIE